MLFVIVATTICANGSEVNLDFANLGSIEVMILGIVQGMTKLLPISSTAYLRVVPILLELQNPVYFWQHLKKINQTEG